MLKLNNILVPLQLKIMRKILTLSLFSLFVFACSNESVEDLADPCNPAEPSYQNEIKGIVDANCATSGCHLGPNAVNNLDLSKYENLKSIAGTGQLISRITGSGGAIMPPTGKMPQCEISKISAWVQDGAPNN